MDGWMDACMPEQCELAPDMLVCWRYQRNLERAEGVRREV